MVPLGKLGDWGGGGTPSKSKPAFWTDGTVPWVSPKDMKFDVIENSQDLITQNAVENSSAKLYPTGTVLLVTRSAILLHSLPVAKTVKEVTVNQDLKALIPADCMNVDYIVAALRASASRILNECRKAGTTVCSIDFSKLKAYEIPVAPLNEQRRIVAKIEELTARSRNAKQALDAIPPLLERFRQSVLAAAFRGDLTKQWRHQNNNPQGEAAPSSVPATELLKRIRQERRHRWEQDYLQTQKAKGKQPKNDKWKEKYQEPEPVDTSGLPELPEGWCWAKLNDFVEFNNGDRGKNYPARSKLGDEGYAAFVNTGDIRPSGLSKENMKYLSQAQYDRLGGGKLAPGDLVFCIRGATIGKCAVYLDSRPAAIASSLVALRPSIVPSDFLWYLLQEPGTARTIRNLNSSSAQPNISTAKMEQVLVALAPHDEQQRIAEILGARLSAIEQTLNSVTVGESRLVGLNQSILAKAFRGELVPQDPNDEPASALLERIRARHKAAGQKRSEEKSKT